MSDELGTHSTHSLVLHSLNLLYCTNPSFTRTLFVWYGWECWAFVQCVCPWCKSHHGSSDAPVQGHDFLHIFWSIDAKDTILDGKPMSAAEMNQLLVRMQPRNTETLHSVSPFIPLCGIMYYVLSGNLDLRSLRPSAWSVFL